MIESLAAGELGRVVEAGEAARRPVGVFDSGWGGLSVLRELRRLLPGEDLVYVADSRFCPYGGRSEVEIQARARAITRYLVERQVKAVVVACNTATGAAVQV